MEERLIGSEIVEMMQVHRYDDEDEKFRVSMLSVPLDIETSGDAYIKIYNFLDNYPHISDTAVKANIYLHQSVEADFDVETDSILNATIIGCEAFFEALEVAEVNGRPTESIED